MHHFVIRIVGGYSISSSKYQEPQLLYLLGSFDKNLTFDCINRAKCNYKSKEKTKIPNSKWIQSRYGNSIAYRFPLKGTQYLMLSHPLSRFRRSQKYWIGYEDSKICTELGLIPVYEVNLNKFTLLKLWGEQARRLFDNRADPIEDEEDYVYWKMKCKKGKQPELSSMNFILKRSAELSPYNGTGCEFFKKYFIFGFWCFPEKGFSDSTIILNDSERVNLVLKASKSIYIPVESYTKKMDLGPEKQLEVEMLSLLGLHKTENYGYTLGKINDVPITKGIIDNLKEQKNQGRFLLNGIVSEFRKRETRFPTLTSVALYEVSNLQLIMSLIGLVVCDRYNNNRSISRVGKVEEIINETQEILNLILKEVCLDRTFGDSVQDQFSLAISYLKPMIAIDNEDLFFMHPAFYIELLNLGYIERILKDQNSLVSLLKILEMVASSSIAEIRYSKERDYLKKKGIFIETLLPSLRNAITQTKISKLCKKPPIITSEVAYPEQQKFVKKPIIKPVRKKHQQKIFVLTEQEKELFQHLNNYKQKNSTLRKD